MNHRGVNQNRKLDKFKIDCNLYEFGATPSRGELVKTTYHQSCGRREFDRYNIMQ